MSNHPKIVLLEGDPYLARDRLTAIKKAIYPESPGPDEWVVFETPDNKTTLKTFLFSGVNALEAETMTPPWDGTHKTVVLRGLANDPRFVAFLHSRVVSIPDGFTFIIWDEGGVIAQEKGAKDPPSWKGLRKLCSTHGKAFNFGEPLDAWGVKEEEVVGFVSSEAGKRGKKISYEDGLAIVHAVGKDRGLIMTEVGKLAMMAAGDSITTEDIMGLVMPLSVDFPAWKFDAAFNSGDRRAILETADMIIRDEMSDIRWTYCMILGHALRMARLHVLVAHAASRGTDMMAEMNTFLSGANAPKEIKGLPSHAFRRKEDDPRDCLGRPPNDYVKSDIISLVRKIISRHSSPTEAYNTTLDNYLWLYDAHSRARVASEQEGRSIFDEAIRAYTEMTPIKELMHQDRNDFLCIT